MTEQPTKSNGGDLVIPSSILTNEDYASITSFEDAMQLVGDKLGGEVVSASDLGDGFGVLDNKQKTQLLGVPFIVLSAAFHEGDHMRDDGEKGEFVSLRIVTKDGRKLVVNDGGSGIYDQVKTLYKMRPQAAGKPILVEKGLRVSEYDHPVHGPSKTFYLDTSAS